MREQCERQYISLQAIPQIVRHSFYGTVRRAMPPLIEQPARDYRDYVWMIR
jgi:hypothetical protein